MTRYKNVNGDVVAYTAEEEAEADILVSDAKIRERAEEHLRAQRNIKLMETDFYALSDVTMSSDMTTYRQALRDLPSNYTVSDSSKLAEDLSNLNWPTKPSS
tara:strand:+ start:989 stop:1294 length:306 start_codon:yes stop_codon:yes gene_type:complete